MVKKAVLVLAVLAFVFSLLPIWNVYAETYQYGWRTPETASGWSEPERTIDDSLCTYSYEDASDWTPYITFSYSSSFPCGKIRVYYLMTVGTADFLETQIYNGSWVTVYNSTATEQTWFEINFTATHITKFRLRFYSSSGIMVNLYEVDAGAGWLFNVYDENTGVASTKTVTVTAHFTDADSETFTVNGETYYFTTNTIRYFMFDYGATETVTQYMLNVLVYNQSSYYDIIFPSVEQDTNYEVNVTLTWNSTYTISNKTTTGCRVNFATPPNEDRYLNWFVRREGTNGVTREYWIQNAGVTSGDINIFTGTFTTYTVSFQDLAGVLDTHPFIEAKRWINGELQTVELRKVDVEDKVVFNLISGSRYTLVIKSESESYTFGDVTFTESTTVVLTLKGTIFPRETLFTQKNVRVYGLRQYGTPYGNITIYYQDLLNQTNSVDIEIAYANGTVVYTASETSSSFQHVWSAALNNTGYKVTLTINHGKYGTYTWTQYFPPEGQTTTPWNFSFLGNLSVNISQLLPALLIVFAGGCFSVLNVEVGAFASAVTAAVLVYLGWVSIPIGFIVAAFMFAILLAVAKAKSEVEL